MGKIGNMIHLYGFYRFSKFWNILPIFLTDFWTIYDQKSQFNVIFNDFRR
jgi:hypothetical protein